MLITEKIQKIKKNIKDFFKGFRQIFLKFNYPQPISKQQAINHLNKVLITEKFRKIKKNSVNFFKNLRQFFVKFNDPEAISKQLTVLIKC